MSKRRTPKRGGHNSYTVIDLLPTCPTPVKVRFYSEAEAVARARMYTEERHKGMRAYQCDGHWHLTSKPRR